MAELEEAETGDRGRAREWLARAVRAPRDPVWTADGVILDSWAPASPVTGRLDTVEWKVPVAELEPPSLHIDAEDLRPAALPVPVAEAEPETQPEAAVPAEEPSAGPEVSNPSLPEPDRRVEEEGSALPIGTLPRTVRLLTRLWPAVPLPNRADPRA
jgi:HemY protein